MVEIYSHSKLWLYENCPEAYKIKYIDKTFPELPGSIHAFLGTSVHDALEYLYKELMSGRVLNLDGVIEYFARNWHANYELGIRVPQGERVEDFFNKGVKFLIDYYQSNLPFSKNTIETEKRLWFPIAEGIYIVGYIDRLEKHDDGSYEVHDYKTNQKMKEQKEVDEDRQLAFYHMGLQDLFGEDVKAKLTWHMLAHNKKIHSFRTKEQLNSLRGKTLELIEKIRNTKEWPACGKRFCDWCSYKALHVSETGADDKEIDVRKIYTLNDSLGKWL